MAGLRSRSGRELLVLGGALLAGLAAGAAYLGLAGDDRISAAGRPCASAEQCVFVDIASAGARCDDARRASSARAPGKPWCSIARAVAAAPPGSTVRLRAGSYPRLKLTGDDRATPLTLEANRSETVKLAGFEIDGVSDLTLRGLQVRDRLDPSTLAGARRVTITGSEFSGQGLLLRAPRSVTIADNRFHDLNRPPGPPGFQGYGIWANGAWQSTAEDGIDGLVIRDNVFSAIPQDAIQIGGGPALVHDVRIEGNDFGFVRRKADGDHPDPIQILGGRDIVIRSNSFHDSEDAIIVKDDVTTGLVVDDNLMVGWGGGCIQAQLWNTPGARVTNNTIWRSACTGLRLAHDPAIGPAPSGIVVRRNVIDRYDAGAAGWVSDQDDNVIIDGPRRGPHDTATPPTFGRGVRAGGVAARLHAGSALRLR